MEQDADEDGIAIVMQLKRPLHDEDRRTAKTLFELWLQHYDAESGAVRDSGMRAEVGAREISLWAQGLRHPGGADGIVAHAEQVAREGAKYLPVAAWRITTAEEGRAERSEGAAPVMPEGLRPRGTWILAVFALRLLVVRLDPAHADALRNAIVLLGIPALHIPSRAWCGRREHVLAAVACGASAVALGYDVAAPGTTGAWIVQAVSAVSSTIWALLWMRRGRRE
jgi:hypothetical protein